MSGPGERSRHVLTRNTLTHAVAKVLPAHLGMVHALSISRWEPAQTSMWRQ